MPSWTPDRAAGGLWQLPVLGQPGGAVQSLGDGQVDFGGVFSKLTQYDFDAGRWSNGNAR